MGACLFTQAMCKLFYFVQSLAYSCSIIILTVISLERYVAIRHPMFSRRFSRTCFVRGAVMGGVWLVSTVYSLPLFIAYDTIHVSGTIAVSSDPPESSGEERKHPEYDPVVASLVSQGDEFCVSTSLKNAHRAYVIINFVLLYIAPLLLMMCVYAQISVVLWRSGSAQSTVTESSLSGTGPKSIGGHPTTAGCRSKSIAAAMQSATINLRPTHLGRAGSLPAELLISVLPPITNEKNGKKTVESTPKIGLKRRMPALQPDVITTATAASTRLRVSVEPASMASQSPASNHIELTDLKITASNGRQNKLLMPPNKVTLATANGRASSAEDLVKETPGDETTNKPSADAIGVSDTDACGSAASSYPSSPVAVGASAVLPRSTQLGSRISLTPVSIGSRYRSGSSSFGVGSVGNGESITSSQSPLIARRKVVRLLVAIVSSFAVCMLPHHVRLQWQEWKAGDSYSVEDMYVPPVTSLVFYVNSFLNPLLYALISDRFRKAFTETRLVAWLLSAVCLHRNGVTSGREASRRRRARLLTVPVSTCVYLRMLRCSMTTHCTCDT